MPDTASASPHNDPYAYDPTHVLPPPVSLVGTLGRIGPGLLLTATIVGTGELIATTVLGAKVGYVMLWAIIFSCVVKTIVQAMWGRYTIATGETGLAAVNHLPGPRLGGVNWVVWAFALMIVCALSLTGAMYAGVAQVMVKVLPGLSEGQWVVLLAIFTFVVLVAGQYRHVEFLSIAMVAIFSIMTMCAALVLTSKPEYFSWQRAAAGLTFSLPEAGIFAFVTVFGLTGVNSGELFAYPYWCVEKGYARYTGAREPTEAWRERARGWIRVMHYDVIASMLVYTSATLAFYLLGAGVLHTLNIVPQGAETIAVLSRMYTETMGAFGLYLFYVGAVFVLYSTVFAATAANSRIFADMLRLMGRFPAGDYAARLRAQRVFVGLLALLPCLLYFATGEITQMVTIGGIVLALMLPVIGCAMLYLRYRRLPPELAPSGWFTAGLWLVTALMLATMVAGLVMKFGAGKT